MQILELPAELLEDIIITIAQTNGSGLRSLRLVCRYFSTICLSHTVRNIIVDVWKFPAPRLLNQLSKNPGMAPLVTNLEVSCKYKTYRPLVSVLEQLSQLQTLSLKVQGADAELHPIEEHRGRVRLPSLRRVRVSCDNFSIPGLFLGVLWSSASYIHEVALYTPMQQVYSGARDDGTTSRPIGVSSLHLTFGHWAADVASALQVLNCFSQVEKATLQLWSPVHLNILAALTAVHGATLHILHLVRDLLPPFRGANLTSIDMGAFTGLRELQITWSGDADADGMGQIGPFFTQLPASRLERILLDFRFSRPSDYSPLDVDWAAVDRSLANATRHPALAAVCISITIRWFGRTLEHRPGGTKARFKNVFSALPALHRRGMLERGKINVLCMGLGV